MLGRRPANAAKLACCCVMTSCKPKVTKFRVERLRKQHVARMQVVVNQTTRVQVVQAVRDSHHDSEEQTQMVFVLPVNHKVPSVDQVVKRPLWSEL